MITAKDHLNEFYEAVEAGIEGKNEGIPLSLPRIGKHVNIRKALTFLVGGYTGSAKTSFLDDVFVLSPFEWYLENKDRCDIKLKIVYWSMERRAQFKLARWHCRRIFLDHGIIVPMNKILGWIRKEERLNKDEHDLVLMYRDYFKELFSLLTLVDYPQNPTGIRNFFYHKDRPAYMDKEGKIEEIDEYNKVFIPNDPNVIYLNLYDHIGLSRGEKELATKKDVVDKICADSRHLRDFYGMTNVQLSQFNREISNVSRLKDKEVEPRLEDFSNSSESQNDADVILSLFDPLRYKVACPSGYDLEKLRDSEGRKYYRSLQILKNSYGIEGVRCGLGFQPDTGIFKELKKKDEMTEDDYRNVTNNQMFGCYSIEPEYTPKRAFSGFSNREQVMETVKQVTI